MKKTNFLKIALTLVMAFIITGVFGQLITPTVTTPEIDGDISNYVEILQADDAGYTGAGANDFDVHINLVTQGSANLPLVEYNAALVGDARYIDGTGNYSFVTPFIVAPDQDISPSSYAAGTMTIANINANTVWAWTWNGADPSGAGGTTFQPTGANLVTFNQVYVDWGDALATYEINVVEGTTLGGGCTSSQTSVISVQVVAYPQASEDGTSSADEADCGSTITAGAANYDLILAVTGTPPFHLGYLYTKVLDQGTGAEATSYLYKTFTTGAATGWSDLTDADNFDYFMTGVGTSWLVTIRMNGVNFTQESGITSHTVAAKYLNGHISRKSDRKAVVGSPDADPTVHCLFAASGDLNITAYPTPNTGNIFTLPN